MPLNFKGLNRLALIKCVKLVISLNFDNKLRPEYLTLPTLRAVVQECKCKLTLCTNYSVRFAVYVSKVLAVHINVDLANSVPANL